MTDACLDCGRLDMPMDFVLPRRHWLLINPGDGGVLCAGCILLRASRLPGVINITGALTFYEQYEGDAATPYEVLTAVTGGALPDTNRCEVTARCCRTMGHGGKCLAPDFVA